jgi:hypothetical protein
MADKMHPWIRRAEFPVPKGDAGAVERANPTHDRKTPSDGRAPRSIMTNAGRASAENIRAWSVWVCANSPKSKPHRS